MQQGMHCSAQVPLQIYVPEKTEVVRLFEQRMAIYKWSLAIIRQAL